MLSMTRRILRWFHEFAGDLLIASIAAAVILTVLLLQQSGGSSPSDMMRLKDLVDVSGKTLTMIVGGGVAIAGYRRFFKGRLLNTRLRLRLSSKPIRWMELTQFAIAGVPHALLHTVDLEIENVGAAVLFEPGVTLKARRLESDEDVALGLMHEGLEGRRAIGALEGIGPGESIVYHFRFFVIDLIPAFRVTAELTGTDGSAWSRTITVANLMSPSDAERSGYARRA